MDAPIKKPRGFAAMDPELHREISRKGGKMNPNRHQFTSDEAKAAGRKGGLAAHAAHAALRRRKQEQNSPPAGEKVESGT